MRKKLSKRTRRSLWVETSELNLQTRIKNVNTTNMMIEETAGTISGITEAEMTEILATVKTGIPVSGETAGKDKEVEVLTEGITETECGETAGVKAEAAAGDEMTPETSAEIPEIDNMSMTENASTV